LSNRDDILSLSSAFALQTPSESKAGHPCFTFTLIDQSLLKIARGNEFQNTGITNNQVGMKKLDSNLEADLLPRSLHDNLEVDLLPRSLHDNLEADLLRRSLHDNEATLKQTFKSEPESNV
jgi:hypothetical protein